MKIFKLTFVLFAMLLLLSGCADSVSFSDAESIDPVGFWHGFWHGMTVSFSWIGSWFSDDIAVYAIYNNGGWYDSGFILGSGMICGSAQASRSRLKGGKK